MLGAQHLLETVSHAEMPRAVLARADGQVGAAQPVEEEGPREERHEGDALVVELAELVEPADRIVGLRLAVREVDDSGVAVTWVTGSARERGYVPVVVSAEYASRPRPVAEAGRREQDGTSPQQVDALELPREQAQ